MPRNNEMEIKTFQTHYVLKWCDSISFQENRDVLMDRAVSYIELGGGVSGTMLDIQASPMLRGVVMDAADQVSCIVSFLLDVKLLKKVSIVDSILELVRN